MYRESDIFSWTLKAVEVGEGKGLQGRVSGVSKDLVGWKYISCVGKLPTTLDCKKCAGVTY